MQTDQTFREQLNSLHSISVEIASLRELPEIYKRALAYCMELTRSELGFIDLLSKSGEYMDIVAVKGFVPSDPTFHDRYRVMPVRRSVFGVTIIDQRPYISNDVASDPNHVGTPPGHPEVRTFLGVPLMVGATVIGMIGAGNRLGGYGDDEERLLATFANQVAVAIDNGRLYERQREMIAGLEDLQQRLGHAERESLLAQDRARIASGLHDSVGQSLFSLGLSVNALLERDLDSENARRVLDIRRMAAGALDELRSAIFTLAAPPDGEPDLTATIQSLLRSVGREHNLDVDLIVQGIPHSMVETLQDDLVAVVREALTNIARHAHAQSVFINMRYESDNVEIVVQDDGVGMPTPGDNEASGRQSHFGLFDMRRRIEGLGGTLTIENGEDCGRHGQDLGARTEDDAMIRVAIIDDHEVVREGVRAMLADDPDFEIVGERDSAEDIADFVSETLPDIVLLDARLPGISGPEACRILGITHPDVKVIILTVYSDDVLVEESIRAGARGYVIKDVERFDLKQSIRTVYRGEAVVSPTIAQRLMDRVRGDANSTAGAANPPVLNERQTQILRLISDGYSNKEIAKRVHLSENTVKSHVQDIFAKLDVRNRVEAAISAARQGLI